MNFGSRLFALLFVFVMILGLGITILLYLSVQRYMPIIGTAFLICILFAFSCGVLLLSCFTYCCMGNWLSERSRRALHSKVIVAGDVVAYPLDDGDFVHLSAIHESAKVKMLPEPEEEEKPDMTVDDETILELLSHGTSIRNVAMACGTTFYRVEKLYAEQLKEDKKAMKRKVAKLKSVPKEVIGAD